METFGKAKMRVRGKWQRIPGRHKLALRPKLTVLRNVQAKQHRPHIQRMQTGPCRNIETFERAKVRVRGKTQRIRERREGGKAVERTSAPAKTYRSRKLRTASPQGVIPPPARKGSDAIPPRLDPWWNSLRAQNKKKEERALEIKTEKKLMSRDGPPGL